jgi:hypothetical protein
MNRQKILILGGGNVGINTAIASLLKDLRIDNHFIEDIELTKKYNFTPERECGWYHCFDKNNKKKKFKKI